MYIMVIILVWLILSWCMKGPLSNILYNFYVWYIFTRFFTTHILLQTKTNTEKQFWLAKTYKLTFRIENLHVRLWFYNIKCVFHLVNGELYVGIYHHACTFTIIFTNWTFHPLIIRFYLITVLNAKIHFPTRKYPM